MTSNVFILRRANITELQNTTTYVSSVFVLSFEILQTGIDFSILSDASFCNLGCFNIVLFLNKILF